MAFYFIYIDEYGNSGTRLVNTGQPVFNLEASLVRADNQSWMDIECQLLDLSLEIQNELRLASTPRLHMVEIYQRKGPYRRATVQQTLGWVERVLDIGSTSDVKNVSELTETGEFGRFAREFIIPLMKERANLPDDALGELEQMYESGKTPVSFYAMTFPFLLGQIDDYLMATDSFGFVILDQHHDYGWYSKLNYWRVMRYRGSFHRIIEAPIYRDSRLATLLALPDFTGYIRAGARVDELQEKHRPMLHEWAERYLEPARIPFEVPDDQAQAVTKFTEHLQRLIAFSAVIALQRHEEPLDDFATTMKIADAILGNP